MCVQDTTEHNVLKTNGYVDAIIRYCLFASYQRHWNPLVNVVCIEPYHDAHCSHEFVSPLISDTSGTPFTNVV